jgi:hypothetical protein
MPLLGTQWRNRDVMRLLWDNHWHDANILMTMGAVLFAESNNYDHAWHWNDSNEPHQDGSTDWGIFQLNDGNYGGVSPDGNGNPQEGGLRTVDQVLTFRDMAWDPYAAAPYARKLYIARGFQPWAAYNSKAFQKYIAQSCVAVCNMLAVLNGLKPVV